MKNRSAPASTIVPILVYEDVGEALAWLCRAFGFAERLRVARDGVISHAQLVVAEGAIMSRTLPRRPGGRRWLPRFMVRSRFWQLQTIRSIPNPRISVWCQPSCGRSCATVDEM